MKRIIRSILALFNLDIVRKRSPTTKSYFSGGMRGGFDRIKKLNIEINTIVDVGAAAGTWSLAAKEFWPGASYLLFEPLSEREAELKALVKNNSNFYFVPCAAGKERGSVLFNISEDLDGSGIADRSLNNPHSRAVEVCTIPDEIDKVKLGGPYLIKLDTHGFEVPIIEGCAGILDKVSVFIIECYGFRIIKDSLLLWEMNQYMQTLGFRLFDLVDIMRRPGDQAFWQTDAFYIREEHPVFQKNTYA